MSTRSSYFLIETPFKSKHGGTWDLHVYRDYRSDKREETRWDATWIEFGPDGYNARLRLWPLPPIVLMSGKGKR